MLFLVIFKSEILTLFLTCIIHQHCSLFRHYQRNTTNNHFPLQLYPHELHRRSPLRDQRQQTSAQKLSQRIVCHTSCYRPLLFDAVCLVQLQQNNLWRYQLQLCKVNLCKTKQSMNRQCILPNVSRFSNQLRIHWLRLSLKDVRLRDKTSSSNQT